MKRTTFVWEGGSFRKNRSSLVLEMKPEVQTFVRLRGKERVSSETNFVLFAGLLRTFAMAPKLTVGVLQVKSSSMLRLVTLATHRVTSK